MKLRRAVVPLLLAATALTACGGDDMDQSAGHAPSATQEAAEGGDTSDTGDTGDVEACDLLSPDDVQEVSGEPMQDGVPTGGQPVTGGEFTGCTWTTAEGAENVGTATVTVYSNAAAADSARTDDAQDLEGIGDRAYTDAFASVWVYVGERSFFAQWYSFDDEAENLEKSEALATAVVDAL